VGRSLAFVLGGALLIAGCSGARTAPASALDRYASALRAKNYDAAYALMSSDYRARVGKDEFVRMLRDNPREVDDTAVRLGSRKRRLQVTADLAYGLGDSLHLVEEDGGWRVADNPLAFYDQSTPRNALRSFVRAYRLERWDVMLRFVPKAYVDLMDVDKMRGQFTGDRKDQNAQLMNALEANIDQPIEELGPAEARMRYGTGMQVTFLREEGRWRLKDLQ
jgi:GGDEF domain-containing protein